MARVIKPKQKYEQVHRFRLEKYRGPSTRYKCPWCNKKKLSRYIDVTTGDQLGNDIGYCNAKVSCGYHVAPTGNDIKDKAILVSSNLILPRYLPPEITNTIDAKYLVKFNNYENNSFARFLYKHYDLYTVNETLRRYQVGTINHWGRNCPIFWQIDQYFDVRTGKIMAYDDNLSRVKEPANLINWIHTNHEDADLELMPDYALTQCFFGEHLLNLEKDQINLVESEKTAILCTIQDPTKIWMATGGLQMINEERMEPLIDKKLVFHPDKGKAHKLWTEKLKPFEEYDYSISNFLEKQESLEDGDDLADYILNKLK